MSHALHTSESCMFHDKHDCQPVCIPCLHSVVELPCTALPSCIACDMGLQRGSPGVLSVSVADSSQNPDHFLPTRHISSLHVDEGGGFRFLSFPWLPLAPPVYCLPCAHCSSPPPSSLDIAPGLRRLQPEQQPHPGQLIMDHFSGLTDAPPPPSRVCSMDCGQGPTRGSHLLPPLQWPPLPAASLQAAQQRRRPYPQSRSQACSSRRQPSPLQLQQQQLRLRRTRGYPHAHSKTGGQSRYSAGVSTSQTRMQVCVCVCGHCMMFVCLLLCSSLPACIAPQLDGHLSHTAHLKHMLQAVTDPGPMLAYRVWVLPGCCQVSAVPCPSALVFAHECHTVRPLRLPVLMLQSFMIFNMLSSYLKKSFTGSPDLCTAYKHRVARVLNMMCRKLVSVWFVWPCAAQPRIAEGTASADGLTEQSSSLAPVHL